jgi:hypothetical protein
LPILERATLDWVHTVLEKSAFPKLAAGCSIGVAFVLAGGKNEQFRVLGYSGWVHSQEVMLPSLTVSIVSQ